MNYENLLAHSRGSAMPQLVERACQHWEARRRATKTQRDLKVRLVGPIRERVQMLSRKLSISEAVAARQVRTTDRERNDFVQDHFLKSPADPRNYDLVVNAMSLSKVENAGLIVDALHRRQRIGTEKRDVPPSA